MQFSLPIIATKWRGIKDIIVDGENGLLVDIKNPQQLAAKIILLINKPNIRKTMGLIGRKKYSEKYTLVKHLHSMEEAIESI